MLIEVIKSSVTLFVIFDVLGLIPIYLNFIKNASKKTVISYANKTILFTTVLLLIFLFFGLYILNFFSISISDFKIAGGLILLIIGIKFVLGLRVVSFKEYKSHSFALVPFATPLLVGPGVITTIMILVETYGYIISILASLVNLLIIWILLKSAKSIFRILGHQGSNILTKIMGLLITAIAVGFIRSGLLS